MGSNYWTGFMAIAMVVLRVGEIQIGHISVLGVHNLQQIGYPFWNLVHTM